MVRLNGADNPLFAITEEATFMAQPLDLAEADGVTACHEFSGGQPEPRPLGELFCLMGPRRV